MTILTLLNGVVCDSPLTNDRALHFGDGLFETIAIRNGDPCLWDRHFLRLKKGCKRLGIPEPDQFLIRREAAQLCQNVSRGVLKIIISAGDVERGYKRTENAQPTRLLSVRDWPGSSPYTNDSPVALALCRTRLASQPLLAGIKHLNRIEQVLARSELADDVFEGIMLNQQGYIVEGIMSNLLIKYGGKFITPCIDDSGVEGVMRGLMLDVAARYQISIKIEKLKPEELLKAEQLYIMNSLLGVRRVSHLDRHEYSMADEIPRWLCEVNSTGLSALTGTL